MPPATPAGTHTALITGLNPGQQYTATVNSGVLTVVAGNGIAADSAGLLRVTY